MLSEYENALQNVMSLMIIADGKIEDKEIKIVRGIYNKLTNNKKISENKLNKIIEKLKQENLSVDDYLKKIKPYLNAEHRESIIKAMYYIASSDGHLDDKEAKLLMHTAQVLEMTSSHIKGVLADLESKPN